MCRQPRKTGLGRKAQRPELSGTGRASGGAVFLTRHKEAIFCSWETRVVSENRGVALTGLALRDDIPEFLEELAAWLASDAAPEESLVAGRALAHVLQRLDAGLSLAQVMREYRLLREVIIEEVLTAEAAEQERAGASDERGRITRIQELARLNAGLDVVLSQSVEHFVNERDRRAAAVRESAAQAMRESEAALKAANAQLMEVDRNKNEFLAVLSHELRNPLSPIVNSLYVLDHAAPEGAQAERAKQIIGRQVGQLSNLVNDLLDVTRVTRKKVHLQKERLDLNEVVRRTVEDNRSLFERAGVRLELSEASRSVPLLADPTRVAQVISNLLQNAAKFTSKGGHTHVTVAVEEAEAVLRVTDDGVGMSRETLDRLFQPFSQAEQALDRSKGGLGLGLSLVKGLADLHGGTVSAHSEGLGHGAEMIVRLPLDTGAALEVAAVRSGVPHARRRILIIEDNVDAANSLMDALAFGGHEVVVAYNGPEGLAKARDFHPEVVLCDIGLPDMDGYDVARAFRADEALKGAFLVALSGYAQPEDLQRAADAGFERHLAKPLSVERLEELLAHTNTTARSGAKTT